VFMPGRPAGRPRLRFAALLVVSATTSAVGCDPGSGQPGAGAPIELGQFAGGPGGGDGPGAAGLNAVPAGAGPTAPAHALDERPALTTFGLDSARLADALRQAATLPRLHNMIVARHGEVVAERNFRGPGLDQPANVKSASKSILSALIGIAVAEGHLAGVEEPVAPFFARQMGADIDPERAAITVGHLLSMRSGLESTSGSNYGRWVTSGDWVRHAITRPLQAPPGTQMTYSTGNTHLLSAILTQATGQSTLEYARSRLAAPLGIQLPPWPRDPQGIFFGGNDMLISPRGLLRFGEMYRNGGVFDGRRVLSEQWVRSSWEVLSRSLRGGGSRNNRNQYGLGWWGRESNGHSVRFAWGYGGQFLFVVPALELSVVFTSDPYSQREGPHNQELHRLIDDFLVPAALAGGRTALPGN